MALNIKDPETDRLARELAGLTGQAITAALRDAIVERLAVVRARNVATTPFEELTAIVARGRARRLLDDRGEDEILGYGDDGLPQ